MAVVVVPCGWFSVRKVNAYLATPMPLITKSLCMFKDDQLTYMGTCDRQQLRWATSPQFGTVYITWTEMRQNRGPHKTDAEWAAELQKIAKKARYVAISSPEGQKLQALFKKAKYVKPTGKKPLN
jgi:hypothetical protein